jgi:lipopolysaccharide transport system permease protein
MIIQFLLTVSFAYPLAALNVTFRDTQHTLGVVLQMIFYLTPIFYDINSVPEKFKIFYYLNPMVPLIEAYRAILLKGMQPDWQALLVLSLAVAALLPIGLGIFRRQRDHFVEEL